MGLRPGDRILQLNGRTPEDFLDLALAEGEGLQSLEVLHNQAEIWEVELQLSPGQRSGILCEQPVPLECGNRCLFCFVHQLPKGMRRSLYLKDEDYRFSYLYGSYITLSNVDETALQRIIDRRLSPLYISVHALDEEVRQTLLGTAQEPILPRLKRLVAAGIELHTQVVACPGINDGPVLEQTIEGLQSLSPRVLSMAVVAVGLTGHRRNLPELQSFDGVGASRVIDLVEAAQKRCLQIRHSRFVWPVDEFYLLARRPIPALTDYENLPQVENGVGLLALFAEEAREALEEAVPLAPVKATLITGESAYPFLTDFAASLTQVTDADLHVVAVHNTFFGGGTSVAGLVTGADILSQVDAPEVGRTLLVPDVMLRQDEPVFLDDVTVEQLASRMKCDVQVIPSTPWGVLDALERLAGEDVEIVR